MDAYACDFVYAVRHDGFLGSRFNERFSDTVLYHFDGRQTIPESVLVWPMRDVDGGLVYERDTPAGKEIFLLSENETQPKLIARGAFAHVFDKRWVAYNRQGRNSEADDWSPLDLATGEDRPIGPYTSDGEDFDRYYSVEPLAQ